MILSHSTYQPNYFFKNKHFNTVYRTLFQQISVDYNRKRLELADGDFIDLDFSKVSSDKIAIVIHGLEGSSNSNYVKAMVKILNQNNMDAVAMNLRGCSGEPNRLYGSYHSGKTDDLQSVFNAISKSYKEIYIIGYSLGGNIALKYLGEIGMNYNNKLKKAATVSVPCDLEGSSLNIAKATNLVYMQRFLRSLKKKSLVKLKQFPNASFTKEQIKVCKNFDDFDNLYTAPAHHFKNAKDYWEKCSSKQFIPQIKLPTLLITSQDDPFLSASCIPVKEAKNNPSFLLEITKHGGHVGFNKNKSSIGNYWLEKRIVQFLQKG